MNSKIYVILAIVSFLLVGCGGNAPVSLTETVTATIIPPIATATATIIPPTATFVPVPVTAGNWEAILKFKVDSDNTFAKIATMPLFHSKKLF